MKQSFFKKIMILLLAIFIFSPIVALAVEPPKLFPDMIPKTGDDFKAYLNAILLNIVTFIWVLFATFAVCMFIYAGFLFLNAKGDGKKVQEARYALAWGAVGVAVALMAFTIPFIVSGLLGF